MIGFIFPLFVFAASGKYLLNDGTSSVVTIDFNFESVCSGARYQQYAVLAPASCFTKAKEKYLAVVKIESGFDISKVHEVITHPRHYKFSSTFDLAILRTPGFLSPNPGLFLSTSSMHFPNSLLHGWCNKMLNSVEVQMNNLVHIHVCQDYNIKTVFPYVASCSIPTSKPPLDFVGTKGAPLISHNSGEPFLVGLKITYAQVSVYPIEFTKVSSFYHWISNHTQF